MLVQWTALQPSLRARRWRQIGLGIAIASAVALAAAAVAAPRFDAGLTLLALLAAAAVCIALRDRAELLLEVGIAPTGEIQLRERRASGAGQADRADHQVRVVFASPWLISVRHGTMLVAIWPDSLPPSSFRRLWVHLRWGRAVPSVEEPPSIGPGSDGRP